PTGTREVSADLQQYACDFAPIYLKVVGPLETHSMTAAADRHSSHHDRHSQAQAVEGAHPAAESNHHRGVNAGAQWTDPGAPTTPSSAALVLSHDYPAGDTLLNLAHSFKIGRVDGEKKIKLILQSRRELSQIMQDDVLIQQVQGGGHAIALACYRMDIHSQLSQALHLLPHSRPTDTEGSAEICPGMKCAVCEQLQ